MDIARHLTLMEATFVVFLRTLTRIVVVLLNSDLITMNFRNPSDMSHVTSSIDPS